jgi:quercetin dioxygenase-like cupin family protein
MDKQTIILKRGEGETLSAMGAEVRFLVSGDTTGRAWSLTECDAPKDSGPPPHNHPWDEAYYILEGAVRFTIDGRETVANPGDFLFVPAGTLHGFQGASEKTARMLFFDAPAASEAFFRELNREIKVMPDDLRKVPEIGERHRIHFAKP